MGYPAGRIALALVAVVLLVFVFETYVADKPSDDSKVEAVSNPQVSPFASIDLPPDKKLESAGFTYGGVSNLYIWYIVRPMLEGEVPERHEIIITDVTNNHKGKFHLVEYTNGDNGQSVP